MCDPTYNKSFNPVPEWKRGSLLSIDMLCSPKTRSNSTLKLCLVDTVIPYWSCQSVVTDVHAKRLGSLDLGLGLGMVVGASMQGGAVCKLRGASGDASVAPDRVYVTLPWMSLAGFGRRPI